jgi:uncharacterized protein (TIGR02145 family)
MDKLTNRARTIKNIVAISILLAASNSYGPLYSMHFTKIKMVELEDSLLVDRDGNRYSVRKMIDNNLWMTTNLKVNIPDSYCYENIKENCDQYGRLYTWKSAQEGCTVLGEGWRLPTNDEWQQLAKYYGSPEDSIDYRKGAFKALLYGGSARFNALFGGNRAPDGQYQRLDAHGFYWTATENDGSTAWLYNFGAGGKFLNRHNDNEKSSAVSVRCVKKATVLK